MLTGAVLQNMIKPFFPDRYEKEIIKNEKNEKNDKNLYHESLIQSI